MNTRVGDSEAEDALSKFGASGISENGGKLGNVRDYVKQNKRQ